MKNLLLLFFLGFALFWVGCEKEEITSFQKSKTSLVKKIEPSEIGKIRLEKIPSHNNSVEFRSENVCCRVFDDLIFQDFTSSSTNPHVRVTFYFVGSELDGSANRNPRVDFDFYVNGSFIGDGFSEVEDYHCSPDEPTAWYIRADISTEDFSGGCPYSVRVDVRLSGVNEGNEFVECERKTLRGDASEFFLPEGQACGVTHGPCYDYEGNPVYCPG